MFDKGVYLLLLELETGRNIKAGRLPETYFNAGFYLYVGRARSGLRQRVERHLRKGKRIFWHIDYFLRKAKIREIFIKPDYLDECRMIMSIIKLLKQARIAQEKFGASDCGCGGHLIYLGKEPNSKKLRKQLGLEKIARKTKFSIDK
jgi:sugar fermentation stimulation protein A